MRTKLRSRLSLLFMSFALMLALPAMAFASSVTVTSVVDVTTPNGAVTLQAGQSENITINMQVTGNQDGTATFEVYRNWQLQADGTFAGSNPQEFTVAPRTSQQAANTFTTAGTVSVASGVAAGGPHTLTVTARDITNSNVTGAKLTDGNDATYSVTVAAPPAPSDTTAPNVTAIARADANPTNDASESWNVTFSESVSGVGTADFALANSGLTGPSITGVTGSGANYTVTANTGSGDGTLGLNLVDDDSIVDGASNKLGGTGAGNGSFTGEIYTIDKTNPVISASAKTQPGGANYTAGDWTNKDVEVSFSCADSGSGIAQNTVAGSTLTASGADQSVTNTGSCTDEAGNVADSATFSNIDIDKDAPVITDAGRKTLANADGWYSTEAFNKFTASDSPSGLADSTKAAFEVGTGAREGSGLTVASGSVSDNAGNTAASLTSTATYNVDLSNPYNVRFIDGPAAGSLPYFGSVPTGPTCSADDAVSGIKSCVVSGYSSAVGTHTMTATATDYAGRTATATRSYTVLAWTLAGFKSPVDMGILNYAKGGATVPLKFEVFSGSTELTSTSVVKTFTQKIDCQAGVGDAIEEYSTGNTELRYDTTGGQFIFNWKTPKAPGSCYRVTMWTQDGSSIYADFQLK